MHERQGDKSYSIFGRDEDGQGSPRPPEPSPEPSSSATEPGTGGPITGDGSQQQLPNAWVLEWHTARLQAIEGRLNVIDRRISQTSDRISVVIDAALGSSSDELRVLVTDRCSSMGTSLERLTRQVEAQAAALEEIYRNAQSGRVESDRRLRNLELVLSASSSLSLGSLHGAKALSPVRQRATNASTSPPPSPKRSGHRSAQSIGVAKDAAAAAAHGARPAAKERAPSSESLSRARPTGDLLPIEEHPARTPRSGFRGDAAPDRPGERRERSPAKQAVLPPTALSESPSLAPLPCSSSHASLAPGQCAPPASGAQFRCSRCSVLVFESQLQHHTADCRGGAPRNAEAPVLRRVGEPVGDSEQRAAESPPCEPPEQVLVRCAREPRDSLGDGRADGQSSPLKASVQRAVSTGDTSGAIASSVPGALRRAISSDWKTAVKAPPWQDRKTLPVGPRGAQGTGNASPQPSARRSLPVAANRGESTESPLLRTRVLPSSSSGTVTPVSTPQTPPSSPLVAARRMPLSARGTVSLARDRG